MSLRKRFVLGSVLTSVLVSAVYYYHDFIVDHEKKSQTTTYIAMRTAEQAGAMVEMKFDQALAIARSHVAGAAVVNLDRGGIDRMWEALAPVYPDYSDVLGVYDDKGDLVGLKNTGRRLANVSNNQWFREVMRTGKPKVSQLVFQASDH